MVTEVFTRKYCDPHAIREEKVEATDVVQFAWEGAIREVDACDECKKEYETRFEPLVDYSRPFKKRRSKKTDAKSEGASEEAKSEGASEDADSPSS